MIGVDPIVRETFFHSRPATAIGRIETAGYYTDPWRTIDWPMRRLEGHGIIFVIEGGGRYRDGADSDIEIEEGDLIFLFPDAPHGYGPATGGTWSEIYVLFDGPIFDTLRFCGLLDPSRPVVHVSDAAHWRRELYELLTRKIDSNTAQQLIQVSEFAGILTHMIASAVTVDRDNRLPRWLQQALDFLDPNVANRDIAWIADECGIPYNTFRKRFKSAMGVSPAQYRKRLLMDAAKSLLTKTNMSVQEIAMGLNFSDAFHFSNQFKLHTGVRPSVYRLEANSHRNRA